MRGHNPRKRAANKRLFVGIGELIVVVVEITGVTEKIGVGNCAVVAGDIRTVVAR